MIDIELLGGQRDGEVRSVSDNIWKSGYFRVMELPDTSMNYKVILYQRRLWNPGWGCLFFDYDGIMKAGRASEYLHKWVCF